MARLTELDPVAAALQELPRGVYVIGTRSGNGMTTVPADWVIQVAASPVLVAVSIKNGNAVLHHIQEAGVLTVNVLDGRATSVFNSSAPPDPAQFELREQSGCPVLREATVWLECRVRKTVPVGDHTLIIARVIDGGSGSPATT
jgi:flavin reductase (DIM6/NTAB) family NADH-FMN oxidoreductase RutF